MGFVPKGKIVKELPCQENRAMLESNPSARQVSTGRWGYFQKYPLFSCPPPGRTNAINSGAKPRF